MKEKALKWYTVKVWVDGMMCPLIGELEIEAPTSKEAKEWVMENLKLTAQEEK